MSQPPSHPSPYPVSAPHPGQPQHQANMSNLPPLHPPRQYSPSPYQQVTSPYQQSPTGMSPGAPPALKRQHMSPNPPSPAYSHSPYGNSPYATSPPGQFLALPNSPATTQAPQPFHQPQPYQHPQQNIMDQQPRQGSMPPPKFPYSKTQDTAELEKADPRGADINQISDVLSGAGVDLRAEEENLLSNYRQANTSFGNATNSQASTISPNNSFGQWPQGATAHGAFQGTGPLSQSVSTQSLEDEHNRKYERAARAYAEAQQYHLNDPFLQGMKIRNKLASRTYEHGITINVEGLYDKIPQTPQNVSRTVLAGTNDEGIMLIKADSILNKDAPLVDIISLISLAAQERMRGILEDAVAMSKIRQMTADGVVPYQWADLAVGKGAAKPTTVVPTNITKTAWEGPDSAVSPMTVPAQKAPQDVDAPRLPTPPTEVPPTPQQSIIFQKNIVVNALKRKATGDLKAEEARVEKRQKRLRANNSAADSPATAAPIIAMPERMTKKERDRINKMGQSEDVLHRKANETARMALGSSKKYSWMTGGGGGSGASTPGRLNTAVPGPSTGASAAPAVDSALRAKEKQLGVHKENGAAGKNVQIRDLLVVLEAEGRDKKTAGAGFARLKAVEKVK